MTDKYPRPASPLTFGKKSLIEHVNKHCLDSRAQRWHQVLGSELIDAARDERCSEKKTDTALNKLCRSYQSYAENIVIENVRESENLSCFSVHEIEAPEPLSSWKIKAWEICVWKRDNNVIVWIRAANRENKKIYYGLKTCFRLNPKLSGRSLSRKIAEMLAFKLAGNSSGFSGQRRLHTIYDAEVIQFLEKLKRRITHEKIKNR